MIINGFSCKNFRNIREAEIKPSEGVNILYGENAQGKTNLIEALWMFTGMKSFRGARDSELKTFDCLRASAELLFYSQGRKQRAELFVNDKRELKLNGVEVSQPVKMSECFPAVVFSPVHLTLVKGGPSERRRFLDSAIAQLRPRYAQGVQEYARAMKQRNALLRDAKSHTDLFDLMELFEKRMADAAARVIKYRQHYCKALAETAPGVYGGLSGGREQLSVRYSFEHTQEIHAVLLDMLSRSREKDLDTGMTSVGPHRDDLFIEIAGLDSRKYGSQGQQRSAVLALKIAEAALLERFSGERPVALLDDVMSELDVSRQEYILNHIEGWQVFITCCDPGTVKRLKDGKTFHVKAGTITDGE